MATTREKPIERYLREQCRINGFLCLKFVSPARGGVPDRIIITPGATVFVEVKRPGEDVNPRQRATHARMRRRGAIIHVVDDHDAIDRLLEELHVLSEPTRRQAG